MVFYLIGLGLGGVEDITIRGLNTLRKCSRVYLEAYTSILSYGLDKNKLEELYGKEVILAERDMVEQNSDEILGDAKESDICMLVVGDPFGATTHADLAIRAHELDIPVVVIHNASILNAVGCCGLQLYKFGETISIVLWTDDWQPDSYYEKISSNMDRGLHTLCLLDIKTKEKSTENLMRGRDIFEPPRYMSCSEAANQLLKIRDKRTERGLSTTYDPETICIGLARVGWSDQKIIACKLREMCITDIGPPLHSLVLPGKMHPMEFAYLEAFAKLGSATGS